MRPYPLGFALLVVAGCASDATSDIPYDDVARSLGPHLVTNRLGDATSVARAGTAPDERDGMFLSYAARCSNSVGKAIACGEWTVNADVTAYWGNGYEAGLARWQLRGIDRDLAFVIADTWAMSGDVELTASGALAWDPRGLVVRAGSLSGTTDAGNAELVTLIVYDGLGHARLALDDRNYVVDLATGEVTLPGVFE
jgi:hypothetical protein